MGIRAPRNTFSSTESETTGSLLTTHSSLLHSLPLSMHQLHNGGIQPLPRFVPVVGARDVAYLHFHARPARLHIDRRLRRERLYPIVSGRLRPLRLRLVRVLLGFLLHKFLESVDYSIGILIAGYRKLQFVPHPLP